MDTSILIITGDAGESYECLYARHRLLEAGLIPVIAAPSRRRLHLVMHDFEEGWDTYVERPGYGADADMALDEVRVEDYQAVLILGGRVQILAAAGLLKGKRVTAYAHCRWEIEAAGGCYVAADQAVRDGRLVTGQTWQSHPEFYRLVFDCLGR